MDSIIIKGLCHPSDRIEPIQVSFGGSKPRKLSRNNSRLYYTLQSEAWPLQDDGWWLLGIDNTTRRDSPALPCWSERNIQQMCQFRFLEWQSIDTAGMAWAIPCLSYQVSKPRIFPDKTYPDHKSNRFELRGALSGESVIHFILAGTEDNPKVYINLSENGGPFRQLTKAEAVTVLPMRHIFYTMPTPVERFLDHSSYVYTFNNFLKVFQGG